MLIDAPHDAEAIKKAIGDRDVTAILCTHSHNDHVNAAPAIAKTFEAPILLNPDDKVIWDLDLPDREPDGTLADGETFTVGGITLRAIGTPGHSPGSTCFYAPDLGTLFSGDTLFNGGPGATGPSYSDFDVIIETLRDKIFTLPGGHHRAHRARRHHEDRRRGPAPRGVPRAGLLSLGRAAAHPDDEYPADPYPGVAPGFSFVHLDAATHRLEPDPGAAGRLARVAGGDRVSTRGSPRAVRRPWPSGSPCSRSAPTGAPRRSPGCATNWGSPDRWSRCGSR